MEAQTKLKDRCVRCLLGLAVGDALGTTLELRGRVHFRDRDVGSETTYFRSDLF